MWFVCPYLSKGEQTGWKILRVYHIDDSVQDSTISNANALRITQFCTKLSMYDMHSSRFHRNNPVTAYYYYTTYLCVTGEM